MALTREVSLKLFADTAKAQAQLDAIAAEADKLGKLNPEIRPTIEKSAALRQLAVLRAELKAEGDKAGQDLGTGISEGTKKGLGGDQRGGSWIATAIGLGAPLTGPLLAGGAAFAAFGGLAVGSILPIGKALTGPGGLAAGWVTLDNRQRNAARGLLALKDHYDQLSKSMEPRTFQVFNTALQTADQLLGPLGKLAASSGGSIEHFLVQFENDSGLRQFIGYAGTVAPQAIRLLGTDVTTLVHTILTLAQAAGGAGLFELKVLTAGLQALDKIISVLPDPLEGAALGLLAVGLAANKIGVLGGLLKITGVAGMGAAAKAAAAGMGELSLAEKGAAASGAALDAVSPLGWAVLATGALTGLVFWLNSMGTATGRTIKTLEDQNKAVGFNTEGYFRAATAIGKYAGENKGAAENLVNLHTGMVTGTTDAGHLSGATDQLTAAQQRLVTSGNRQNEFLTILQRKYGITEEAARSLAFHSGVLAKDVNKGGQSFKDAVTQAEAYGNANLKAQRPTSQLAKDIQGYSNKTLTAKDRTTALSDALSQFFNPAVTADQALITLAGDAKDAAKALDAAGGKTEKLTGKQGAARAAFDTYIGQVGATASQVFAATGKTSDYNRIIDANIPRLEKMAGKNKALRKLIQDLINTEKGLKSENVRLTVMAHGKWNLSGQSLPGGFPGGTGAARGMFITAGTTPTADDVLARVSKGELVVPTQIVSSGAVDHLRGKIPGFASGGVAGSYADGLGGLNKWVRSENAATVRAIADALVVAMHRAAQAGAGGQAFPGGLGRAGLRYLEGLWTGAGGPGAGTAHVAAAIALAESGGNPRAFNPSGASGLWQILGAVDPRDQPFLFNPQVNAREAVLKYRGAGGFSPWVTFETGAYRQFMDSGGWLAPGWNPPMYNATGRPEHLVPAGQDENLAPLLRQVIAELRKLPGVQAAQLGRVLSGRPLAPRPSVFASR